MAFFEVRYLDIVWKDKDEVQKIIFSDRALPLESVNTGYELETVTYTETNNLIGIHIPNKDMNSEAPYFVLANGEKEYLSPIVVPGTDKVWWIQKTTWNERSKKWYSEIYRVAGRYEIQIEYTTLTIINSTSNFTVEELEYYLKDFKNNLWMLILDNNSAAKATIEKEDKRGTVFNEELLTLLNDYIKALDNIIIKPTMHLKETQDKRPIRSVKPLPKTFREIATNPTAKMLTSRAFYESFDTPENRYIHYSLARVLFMVKSFNRVSNSQVSIFQQNLKELDESIRYYEAMEYKVVDPAAYDNEISKFEHELIEAKRSLQIAKKEDKCQTENIQYLHYTIKLGKNYANKENEYFVLDLDNVGFYNLKTKLSGLYLVVSFKDMTPKNIGFSKIEIKGKGRKWKATNRSGAPFYRMDFYNVTEVIFPEHEDMKNKRRVLESKNWVDTLTKEERDDRDMEIKTLSRKKEMIDAVMDDLKIFSSKIPDIEKKLIEKLRFFLRNKVKRQSHCPNSMVFVQNPSYVAVKSIYQIISQLEGLSETLLDGLMKVEEIGLVSVPDLYERWCLIQILKVLTSIYQFNLDKGWEDRLINLILTEGKDIELLMHNHQRQQELILTYEKILPSGKIPDYVIDLKSLGDYSKTISDEDDWYYDTQYTMKQPQPTARLVLDAKFRGDISESSLLQIVKELYVDKNYSENGNNQVFVIHPVDKSIDRERTSPLEWGRDCNYGQAQNIGMLEPNMSNSDFNSQQKDSPQHRYGHIFLNPSFKNAGSIDNLQRLLGLFLQQNSQLGDTIQNGVVSQHSFCCIGCGNDHQESFFVRLTSTEGGNPRYELECKKCSLFSVKTVCYACSVRNLFKNGYKWTYHRTRATQVSNIVCYQCERFL